ncbi:MAG: exonuclease subunit SbcD [Bacteroidia bacterium]|nr:exonuclease subunit SbcD [Bacteroidia bacterium]
MRLLHTADWHLGKRLEQVSRLDEQRAALDELCGIADREAVDAVLVAGDLFDQPNPPVEAVELCYRTLRRLSANGRRAVIVIAGNHDSPDRIEAPDPLARACGIFFAGYPDSQIPPLELETGLKVLHSEPGFAAFQLPGHPAPLRLLLTPYANELRLRKYLGQDDPDAELRNLLRQRWAELADRHCDSQGVNVLMAHLFCMQRGGERPEEPEDEKPILTVGGAREIYTDLIPAQIQYTALGHLHRFQVVDERPGPVVYSSSLLAYSMSEAGQTKYVCIAEAAPGQPVQLRPIPLESGRPLHRVRFENVPDALEWLRAHPQALVELTLASDEYLEAAQRKALYEAHPGIVTLIPVLRKPETTAAVRAASIDLTQDMESLFAEYFRHRHGQPPSASMLDLFREVLAEDPEA